MKNIIFGVILLLGCFASAGVYIGNGGEAVLKEGRWFLRDFNEAGLNELPELQRVGPSQIPEFAFRELPFSEEVQTGLLLELTRIENIRPGLGWILLKAIRAHKWALIDDPLKPVPEDGGVTLPKDQAYTVANRFLNVIRLQKKIWPKLPLRHQVGLLIHEALFSMVTADCDGENCDFKNSSVRNLVSETFSAFSSAQFDSVLSRLNFLFSPNSLGLEVGIREKSNFSKTGVKWTTLPRAVSSFCSRPKTGKEFFLKNIPRLSARDFERNGTYQQTFVVLLQTVVLSEADFSGENCVKNLMQRLESELLESFSYEDKEQDSMEKLLLDLLVPFPAAKNSMQELGEVLTYVRTHRSSCEDLIVRFVTRETRMMYLKSLSKEDLVQTLYTSFFRRPVDSSGRSFYLDQLNQGRTVLWFIQDLARSPEMSARCQSLPNKLVHRRR